MPDEIGLIGRLRNGDGRWASTTKDTEKMTLLLTPRIVVLDSSTLGTIANDYWNADEARRAKARSFIERMATAGAYTSLSLTHLQELFRHLDESKVRERFRFLASLPCVAWIRPIDQSWFVGSVACVLSYEMRQLEKRGCHLRWRDFVNEIRPKLWETGVGFDMFDESNPVWNKLIAMTKSSTTRDDIIASVSHVNFLGDLSNEMTLAEVEALPKRSEAEMNRFFSEYCQSIGNDISTTGEKRIRGNATEIANSITKQFLENAKSLLNGSVSGQLIKACGVPQSWVSPKTTIQELSEFCSLCKRIQMCKERIGCQFDVSNIGPETFPTLTVDRLLSQIQKTAVNAEGGNLGDCAIGSIAFYCDAMEVDKRTFEYLNQIRRKRPDVDELLPTLLKAGDYGSIPDRLGAR